MTTREVYSGSITWVPMTVVYFTLRLVCFSLLAIGFSHCSSSSAAVLNNTRAHGPLNRDPKLIEIHKRLRALNKPAVKSIQSPDGDIIDCVLRHKQLAFDHPLLKNHTIQTFSRRPHGIRSSSKGNRTLRRPFQVWHLSGMKCPDGTIPVRRKTVEDLMRAESPELYGKKVRGFHRRPRESEKAVDPQEGHEHVLFFVPDGDYYGGEGTINIWRPLVEVPREFSVSQMWITAGSYENGDLNTIEVGWQVYPGLYSNNDVKFFIFWTRDAYQRTGCYNIDCSGFVQTDTEIEVGGTISPTSVYDGQQYEIRFFVWKDPVQGSWVLEVEDDTEVGYWPADLFTRLAHSAEQIEWGGEIVNLHSRGQHTTTEMGNGHFADEGLNRASYFRNLKTVDENLDIHDAHIAGNQVNNENCYSLDVTNDRNLGELFFYGGPGLNPLCRH